MPRIARIVVPDVPHHVIQRGNRNQRVFFNDEDKRLYLKILGFYCHEEKVKIWCYCLMDNHVHLIAVPGNGENLRRAIGETHKKYTWMINAKNNWKGYLWQGRFLSYPMDEAYLFNCIRYIERNPVRAGLVAKAEDYRWSSARAHVFGQNDGILSAIPLARDIKDWAGFLRGQESEEELMRFREYARSGKPLGSSEFIKSLEWTLGIKIKINPPGRPRIH
ncbi:MAG: transposase [Acidobacteriota bacterium]|nr:transposase [Acidobacteriota bacterium]